MPDFRRILLTRMKFIGDVVLTTPIIHSVRNALPCAYIAYMGDKHAVSLLEHNPHLDEVIPFDFSRPTLIEQSRVAWELRRRKFDLAIDLFGNPRSALLTFLSGATTRVGPARRGRGRLYTLQVRDDGEPKTAIDFHNQYITALGIKPTATKTEIVVTHAEKEAAKNRLAASSPLDTPGPWIGIHPGATWPAKKWIPERFAELGDTVAMKMGARVVITSGPKDRETIEVVLGLMKTNPQVLENPTLRQLAAVASLCDVFVSNDAGPMHIAAAVGTPTIGLFGPGEENIWFPYSAGEGHIALRMDVACHPCHLDFCNRQGDGYMECMKLLSVEEVFGEVKKRLTGRKQTSPS